MMESDEERKNPKTFGVYLLAAIVVVIAAPAAFFATCTAVTEGAVRVAAPEAQGEAAQGNYIIYGLFLGIPLGLVAAGSIVWFVSRRAESVMQKRREKMEILQQSEEE